MAEGTPGEIIGRNVRAVREAQLFSRPELARRSGVSLAGIDHLERGLSARPRRSTVEKLAKALGVDVEVLMEETERPLAETPPLPEQRSFNGLLEEERHRAEREKLAASLPGWIRAAVEDEGFVRRFEEAKQSAESASRLVAEELAEADRGSERVRNLKGQNAPPAELQSARRDLRQAKARFSAAMFLDADLLRGKDVSDLRAVDYVAEIAATQRELLAGGFFEEVDRPQAGEVG